MDPGLTTVFCVTYRTFMGPKELLAALATRYKEIEGNPEMRLVREKTLGLLQKWVDMFPRDFVDSEMRTLAMVFVCVIVKTKPWTPTLAQLIMKSAEPAPYEPLVAEDPAGAAAAAAAPLNFLDTNPEEVARQMCLLDAHAFSYIQVEELLDPKNWVSKDGKDGPYPAVNVMAFIKRWNRITSLLLTETVDKEDYKERAKVLRHFINIARECIKARNYNAAVAIAFGFKSPAVSRMHQTLDYLSKKLLRKNEKLALEELERITDSSSNWKHLRQIMDEACPPAVPHIGIYLGDITFLSDGNPDMVGAMVNFSKKRKLSSIISKFTSYQKTPYSYQLNERIARWIEYAPLLSRDACFEKSKRLEPAQQ